MVVAVGFGATAWAVAPKKTTTVVDTKKLCPVCAKKIVARLQQMDGVVDARADVKLKKFAVLPVSGRVLSPRARWDTVERGGERPIRLAGPSGTFYEKPSF
jgi:Cu+-exporting ATPase